MASWKILSDIFENQEPLYEFYPEFDGPGMEAEIRTFIRLPEDVDDAYTLTGQEEIVILYVNNGDSTMGFSTVIDLSEGGEKRTRRVNVKGYEDAFGDNRIDFGAPANPSDSGRKTEQAGKAEEAEDTAAGGMAETDAADGGWIEETDASEDGEGKTGDAAEAGRAEETAGAAEAGRAEETEDSAEADGVEESADSAESGRVTEADDAAGAGKRMTGIPQRTPRTPRTPRTQIQRLQSLWPDVPPMKYQG